MIIRKYVQSLWKGVGIHCYIHNLALLVQAMDVTIRYCRGYIWNWNKNSQIGQIGQIGQNQFDFGLQNSRNGQIRLLHKKLII